MVFRTRARTRVGVAFVSAIAVLVPVGSRVAEARRTEPARSAVTSPFGLGTGFVENRGQWGSDTRFLVRRGALAAVLRDGAIEILGPDVSLSLAFEGNVRKADLIGEGRLDGRYNFFLGNDPARWRSSVSSFRSVLYRGVYAGVDVRIREESGRLEYDVELAPGADLTQVVIRADGASALRHERDGSLLVSAGSRSLRQTPPRTWEVLLDGRRREIASRFRLIGGNRYGFEAPGRDEKLAMVVDPGLEWSTFLGGFDREEIHGLAVAKDGTGDVIVAGSTWSADFPATAGSKGATTPLVPFVARLTSNGSSLVYATLFGGNDGNVAFGLDLALDASSGPVVVGETNSATFPTTPGSYDPTFNEPSVTINRGWDAFVTRFSPSGAIVFSTFLGAPPTFDPNQVGSKRGGDESAYAVAVDAAGNILVSGVTDSDDFPTTAGAYDRTHEYLEVPVAVGENAGTAIADTDSFVARLDPTLSQLTYSTFLGGQADDAVRDLVVDAQGFVTVVGVQAPIETFDGAGNRTDHGTPFPTTPDAVTRTYLGASDVILARLKLDGAGAADLKYSTIFGGFYVDDATAIALDPSDPELVTICGSTRSWDFPTTAGAFKRAAIFLADGTPYYSGIVSRFRIPAAGGGGLLWSTLIEGDIGAQIAASVSIDSPSGDVIVVGVDEGGLSTTDRSFRRAPSTGIFVYRLSSDGRRLLYGTFLHKGSTLFHDGLLVAGTGPRAVIVAGNTLLTDFPTTPGAFDRLFGSDGTSDNFHRYDAFVAKMTLDPNASADTTAAAPSLLGPADGVALPAGADIPFDWTDVADPSGVQLYELDVSANPDFATGFGFFFLPNFGFFPTSQYTAPANGTGVFYWRVRTLDGANNFSPWSPTRRFSVGDSSWTNFAAVVLTPNGAIGGSTVQGKLFVQNFAPPGGIVYTLTSSNPSAATVPASVTVPGGANSATFTVTTKAVSKSTPVQLTVWAEGNGEHPVLWVDPAPPGVLMLSALSLSPASVTGGATSQGTVTLNGAAPAGGAVVTLSSGNPAVASVPASVTVGAGVTSAGFAVSTTSVASSTSVAITGTYGGASRTAALTVGPVVPPAAPTLLSPANDARPAQPVLFDWSDVSGAASYTIQLDDSSSFSAPLVATQNVTASSATIGGLPARRLWWRVRAVNSAGTPGAFSASRRVEPQSAPAATPTRTPTRTPTSVAPSPPTPTRTPTSVAPPPPTPTPTRTPTTGPPPPPSPTRTRTATPPPTATPGATLTAPSLVSPGSDARFSPGQTVNFDWTDVAGAAGYTLHVDDSDSFSSPLVLSQATTASQFSTSTLPTRTMWFRVRAQNASGTLGPWSSIRRFEVKD